MRTKMTTAAVAAIAALALAGCSADTETPTATPTVEQSAAPEDADGEDEDEASEPAAEEETAASVSADEANAALREALGVFGDDTYQSLTPDMWGFYVADVQVPARDLIRVTLQVDRDNDGDRQIVDGSSQAIFSLIGQQFPDINTVEVVDSAGVHIEQTYRRNVPLLNR